MLTEQMAEGITIIWKKAYLDNPADFPLYLNDLMIWIANTYPSIPANPLYSDIPWSGF